MVVPVSGIRHAIAIDFDPVDKFLYWSDDEKLEIKRCRMNGQSKLEVTLHVIFMVILFQRLHCWELAHYECFLRTLFVMFYIYIVYICLKILPGLTSQMLAMFRGGFSVGVIRCQLLQY